MAEADLDNGVNLGLHTEWLETVLDAVVPGSVEALTLRNSYFLSLVIFSRAFAGDVQRESDAKDAERVSIRVYRAIRQLQRWWKSNSVAVAEELPFVERQISATNLVRYQDTLRQTVGYWESLGHYFIVGPEKKGFGWGSDRFAASIHGTHLVLTARLFVFATWDGDLEGLRWFSDCLLKWRTTMLLGRAHVNYNVETAATLMTTETFSLSRSAVSQGLVALVETEASDEILTDLYWCIHTNHWRDCLLTTAACLVSLAVPQNATPVVAEAVRRLVDGEPAKRGNEGHEPLKFAMNGHEALLCLARIFFAEGGYASGYRAVMDRFIQGILEVRDDPYVPYRLHTSSVVDGTERLLSAYAFVLLLCGDWLRDYDLLLALDAWKGVENRRLRGYILLLQSLRQRVSEDDFSGYRPFYDLVRPRAEEGFTSSRETLVRVLERLEQTLTTELRARCEAAPLDEERLSLVSSSVSAVLERAAEIQPFCLFAGIEVEPLTTKPLEASRRGQDRGNFTIPLYSETFDEESFSRLGDIARSLSAEHAVQAVVEQLKPAVRTVTSEKEFWNQVEEAAAVLRNHGLHPVLLMASSITPLWLRQSLRNSKSEPSASGVRHVLEKVSDGPGYLGTFNGVAVYAAPMRPGNSLLAARETFDRLTFGGTIGKPNVAVALNPTAEPTVVDVRVAWQLQVGVRTVPALLLISE